MRRSPKPKHLKNYRNYYHIDHNGHIKDSNTITPTSSILNCGKWSISHKTTENGLTWVLRIDLGFEISATHFGNVHV